MNQFKERLKSKRSFNKIYEKGKNGEKVYKGSILPQQELNTKYCLATVSCFVINKKGEILVEERSHEKKVSPYALDIVSGHIDNNETPTQAMIREYVEELHLICDGRGYYVQFYCLMTELEVITRQKEEVKNVKWFPKEEAFEMIRQGKTGLVYDKKIEKVFEQVRKLYYQENENCLTR